MSLGLGRPTYVPWSWSALMEFGVHTLETYYSYSLLGSWEYLRLAGPWLKESVGLCTGPRTYTSLDKVSVVAN